MNNSKSEEIMVLRERSNFSGHSHSFCDEDVTSCERGYYIYIGYIMKILQ